jgi:glycine/D-amino acid oxidase-like deaminating enzyme
VRNGQVSYWVSSEQLRPTRPPIEGPTTADICVVGAGFTGLWSAYYLKRAQPESRIVVIDANFAGFGASGRNGGWLAPHFPTPRSKLLSESGEQGARATETAIAGAVDEVVEVCRTNNVSADILESGRLIVARTPAQEARLRAGVADDRRLGYGDDLVELEGNEAQARIRVAGARYAVYRPHGARVHPAKLVRGLAELAERLGVEIFERTRATEIAPGAVVTDRGTIRAASILRCLEGFTPTLRGHQRTLLPLNSAMVITEPLPQHIWDEIGWSRGELLGDGAHAYMYAQRTADGRIAFGGRGIPYRFGSRTDRGGQTQGATIRQLTAELHAFFPPVRSARIEHAWCGVLGVARNWHAAVNYDRATGLGSAGGYVGNGVATCNLAGRTLCDLVLGRESTLTALPWVGATARTWEPEPLRYVGARLVYGLYRSADRRERRSSPATSRLASAADWLSGRR